MAGYRLMKFQNKYRTTTTRLKYWNSASPGMYFVTICTKNRVEWFGTVKVGKMILNEMGKIVKEEWIKTGELRKNIKVDEFIIMPNHVHGIICINLGNDHVESYSNATLHQTEYKNKFGPQVNNLSSIIRGFKGAVTRLIRKQQNQKFAWQSRFYDHIIRNDQSLERIQTYILSNPINWPKNKNIIDEDKNLF
jgi:REP element-mobilizing transposase RayT